MLDEELNEILTLEDFEAIVWEKYVAPAFEELDNIAEEMEVPRERGR
jgi:hypothetical protein